MFGLHTLLFAKQSIHTRIENIGTSQSAKGPSGAKGAVSIRFRIADTTFCFLNCHLESGVGRELTQKRFWMAKEICNDSFK